MLSPLTPQHPLARGRNIVWAAAGCLVLLIFWRAFPALDIALSDLFFVPEKCGVSGDVEKICGAFSVSFNPLFLSLREIGLRLPQLILLGVMIWGLANLVWQYDPLKRFWQGPVVALLAMVLGPVIIVNLILKTHLGRARPFQLEMFGSKQPFSLPGSFADNCPFNCSFPSGEAAAATWLLFIIPFLPRPLRWPVGILIGVFIIGVSLLRVAKGRHFPSDVTMGIALSLLALTVAFWLAARVPTSWHRWRGKSALQN